MDFLYYTEEEFETMKIDFIAYMEESYIEEGVCEECKDEMIELVKSLEYDTSYAYCYDYENLCKSYLEILRKYDELPAEADSPVSDGLLRCGSAGSARTGGDGHR